MRTTYVLYFLTFIFSASSDGNYRVLNLQKCRVNEKYGVLENCYFIGGYLFNIKVKQSDAIVDFVLVSNSFEKLQC